jgi:hypothetical protein
VLTLRTNGTMIVQSTNRSSHRLIAGYQRLVVDAGPGGYVDAAAYVSFSSA